MTAESYRDLFALMLDGATARARRGDIAGLNEPARLIPELAAALPEEERRLLHEGMELDRKAHLRAVTP